MAIAKSKGASPNPDTPEDTAAPEPVVLTDAEQDAAEVVADILEGADDIFHAGIVNLASDVSGLVDALDTHHGSRWLAFLNQVHLNLTARVR